MLRQHAATVAGHGALVPIFAQIAPMVASQLARVLQKHGERHRRRRALNAEAKQVAMAMDSSIWALGMICEHQERHVGGDSSLAWKMWLSHMPPRCDRDVGAKAHRASLGLVLLAGLLAAAALGAAEPSGGDISRATAKGAGDPSGGLQVGAVVWRTEAFRGRGTRMASWIRLGMSSYKGCKVSLPKASTLLQIFK